MDFKTLLYSASDESTQRFYQCPKAFDELEYYRNMSIGAKYMYAILRDRQDLSIKNNWLDDAGFIYFYFDCVKLSEILNISTNTVNNYKKDLEKHKLLLQIRQGQGKPNRMYILKPVTVANTLNSEISISSIAETAFLELRKSLTSDTDFNNTELIRLNTYITSGGSNADFVSLYSCLYSDWFEKSHPRIKKESISGMEYKIDELLSCVDSREEITDMIMEYLEQLPETNNGNILAFLEAKERYLLNGTW